MTTWILNATGQETAAKAFDSLAVFMNTLPDAVMGRLYSWQRRSSERRHLIGLDERFLVDAGLDRADIEREAAKPFWRA